MHPKIEIKVLAHSAVCLQSFTHKPILLTLTNVWSERGNFIDLYVSMLISEEGIDQVQARKLITKILPFSRNTINNVLKEKMIHGNVLGGSSPRSRLRRFDMLSDEQKEQIRKLV